MKPNTGALRYFGRIKNGTTPASGEAEYWDGDVKWATPEDLGKLTGDKIASTKRQVTQKAVEETNLSVLPVGSVLISTRAPIGHMAITEEPMAFNQGCRGIIPANRVHGPFLYYLLKSRASELNAMANGTTFVELSRDELAAVRVTFPPLETQRRIARFLDKKTAQIDALIEKKRALLDRLAEKRQALITRTITKGLNPDAPMKPSGIDWLGDIPAHWEVKALKYISTIGNGSTPQRDNPAYWQEGTYPWLNSSVVNLEFVSEASDFVTDVALQECHLPRIEPPAVLVGITGQGRTRGMASLLIFEATINQHLAYIKPHRNIADAAYIRYVITVAYTYLRNESDGAGSTKGAITCEQLAHMRVPVPPCSEQVVIAAHVDNDCSRVGQLVAGVTSSIERLTEYRSALITAAVTGQLEVA